MREISVVLTSLMLLSAAGCSPSSPPDAAAVVEVTVTHVERADISEMLTLSGSVIALPNRDIRVSSLVAGRIAELAAAEGDRVQAGEVLARVDARPYQDQLTQAEAAEAQARANVENAALANQRNQDLLQRGIAARKDAEDARTQESVAQAVLKQAQAAVALAQLQLTRTEVKSPVSGFVVKRFINAGEQVDGTASQPLVEVANLDSVELIVNVPALYLGKLHANESLTLRLDTFPDKTFAGRVVAIPAAVDPANGSGSVRIRIANPGNLLRLGMFLKTELALETHHQALVIPAPALYHDEQSRPVVYRVNGDTATATPVKIGVTTPEKVEILDGVKEGEAIVQNGGYGLADKAQIAVKGGDAR
ncbi:MAG: efflux RND transporter periplasmic adaptor subunit [Terriglobales bacterium]